MLAGLAFFGDSLLLVSAVIVFIVGEGGFDCGQPALDDAAEAVERQGPDVVLDVAPPGGDHAGELESVEDSERLERGDEGVEQVLAGVHHLPGVRQFDDVLDVAVPPVVERLVQLGFLRGGQRRDLVRRLLPASGREVVITTVSFGEK